MSCDVRLLDYNYVWDGVTDILPTSENSNFPASNLTHFFRSKVWRSSGYFVIASTNKKVNFKTSGGGLELTATLTEGDYTPAELATEIQTQMRAAAGDSNISVAYGSTTGLWTISTIGAFLSLLWDTGTDSASSVGPTIGMADADYTGALTYTGAYIAIHTVERIVFDLKTREEIDSFALVFNPLTSPKFTNQAVLKLKASDTNVWDSPPVDVTLSLDEDWGVVTHFFSTAQDYRYYCLEITDPQNPNLYVEVPKVFLSKSAALTQAPEMGFGYTVKDQTDFDTNKYGFEFADIYPNRRQFDFDYRVMDEGDIETLQLIYDRIGNVVPVFFSLDSQSLLFDKDRFCIYGKLRGELTPKHVITTYFDQSLRIQESL